MRILHTSDWHIGRTFHGHSTLDALRGVLAELTAQVRENAVDVVIVAGDVFDSSAPAADSYVLLTETLRGLADAGARVIVTSGNHDSAARLGFQAGLLREEISVITDPASIGTPITIPDAHGPVHFYGIPYLEPALLRHVWPGVRTQEGALSHAMGLVRADAAARRQADGAARTVAIAHCFAAGVAPTPQLERDIQQGGLDVVPLSVFEGMDYAALGHIHGRQRLTERVRYAGAPLHYSFGEGDKPRGSWLIDLGANDAGADDADAGSHLDVRWLPLSVPRRVVTLTASLEELLSDERFDVDRDAWVCAEYTDDLPQRDPLRRLQERFPHCAKVVHRPARVAAADGATYAQRVRAARSDRELVEAFLVHVREGVGASEAEQELIDDVLAARVRVEAAA